MRFRLWALSVLMSGSALAAQRGGGQVEWPSVGGDPGNAKSSPLTDINADNVQRLKVAWQWKHSEDRREEFGTVPGNFENTPLMIDGVLYVTTPYNNVAALDAATGKELWRFDGEAYKARPDSRHRIQASRRRRVARRLRGCGSSSTAAPGCSRLDAKTGSRSPTFGTGGCGLTRPQGFPGGKIAEEQVTQGLVAGRLQGPGHRRARGAAIAISCKSDPPGIVQAFDARTGKLVWVFNIIPQAPDDFGADTWGNESWQFTGHANVWAPMTLDDERGLLYLPTSTPSSDYYGGRRPGANLFAESLVCLDAATGTAEVALPDGASRAVGLRHPSAPNLVTITVDGKRIDAVVQVTKQGFAFVFDRVTGVPVWPIEERPVPTDSDVPGEQVVPDAAVPDQAAGRSRRRACRSTTRTI